MTVIPHTLVRKMKCIGLVRKMKCIGSCLQHPQANDIDLKFLEETVLRCPKWV